MKEKDLIEKMVEARVKYYRTITYVLLGLATFCVMSLAGTIYLPTHTEDKVLSAFISLASSLFGALIAILTQGIQQARRLRSDEELLLAAEQIATDKLRAQEDALKKNLTTKPQEGILNTYDEHGTVTSKENGT